MSHDDDDDFDPALEALPPPPPDFPFLGGHPPPATKIGRATPDAIRDARAGVEVGPGTFKLADGTVILLQDHLAGSMYSALVLDPLTTLAKADGYPYELFGYGVSQPMACGRTATRTHTNVPRGGYNGLPQAYEGLVTGWHAQLSEPRNPLIDAWASSINATFRYREKVYFECPLIDLIAKADVGAPDPDKALDGGDAAVDLLSDTLRNPAPVRMQANLSYKVVLEPYKTQPAEDLAAYLTTTVPTKKLDFDQQIALERLDVVKDFAGGAVHTHIVDTMRRLRGGETTTRTITLWIHLDGLWLRPVV
jgi:hypothetical protein